MEFAPRPRCVVWFVSCALEFAPRPRCVGWFKTWVPILGIRVVRGLDNFRGDRGLSKGVRLRIFLRLGRVQQRKISQLYVVLNLARWGCYCLLMLIFPKRRWLIWLPKIWVMCPLQPVYVHHLFSTFLLYYLIVQIGDLNCDLVRSSPGF